MKQYETFVFESCAFEEERDIIELHYSLDGEVSFTETIKFPKQEYQKVDPELMERAVFALHIIGGISYFKTCCPKKIIIKSGKLTERQAKFWNSVYENGLGEFFYKNNIDFTDLIDFPVSTEEEPEYIETSIDPRKILVPIGGGKDSMVTIELLREAEVDPLLVRMGTHPLIDNMVEITGLPHLTIERKLSEKLFTLNEEGALNGHIPITAYLSFLNVICALRTGSGFIAMSNEQSANEGNVLFHGKEINHQWSKSLEFERAFQEYVRSFITPDIIYFSMLRPLSELHIAKLFSEHEQYFSAVTSCNANWSIRNSTEKKWCGVCPKCAFVFVILAAFLPQKTVTEMFGGNLLNMKEKLPLYKKLLGIEGHKPFECVGTPEETKAALLLINQKDEFKRSATMKMFIEEVLPTIEDPEELIEEALSPNLDHSVPPEFATLLPRPHAHSRASS